MPLQSRIPLIIGLLIAVLLQLVFAPVITVGNAMPNFILAYVIALAFANKEGTNLLIAFFGGLVYDLSGIGPVGAMALICVVAMLVCSTVRRIVDSDGIIMPLIMLAIACFISEFLYGALMIACGIDVGLLDALLFRMLPCALYDIVIAIIAYLLCIRFLLRERDASEMRIIDNGVD